MRTLARALLLLAAPAAFAFAAAAPAAAAGDGPPPGAPSNMGLCSPYLAGLPAPVSPLTGEVLGGNARSGVNLLIKQIGPLLPDELQNPGQLYKIRAKEHPTDGAQQECLPRPTPPGA
jgi:hypothetical protein